ncbi:MAG: hypothetical protein HGB00_01065 [Chlorobiaceae bacterium]|nr:hypothetical protein [Chlorobiaceae bacterium]
MTTANDPIKSIQSRIDELEQSIAERGEHIKARTLQLKEELQDELSPVELIRKHPVEAAGASFVTGVLLGRAIKSIVSPTPHRPSVQSDPADKQRSTLSATIGIIGIELLHTAKDLGIAWLKNYIEEKKNKPSGAQ